MNYSVAFVRKQNKLLIVKDDYRQEKHFIYKMPRLQRFNGHNVNLLFVFHPDAEVRKVIFDRVMANDNSLVDDLRKLLINDSSVLLFTDKGYVKYSVTEDFFTTTHALETDDVHYFGDQKIVEHVKKYNEPNIELREAMFDRVLNIYYEYVFIADI